MLAVPAGRFVGMDNRAGQDDLADLGNCRALAGGHNRRPATALTGDNDGLLLARLFGGIPAVRPVHLLILLPGMSADI